MSTIKVNSIKNTATNDGGIAIDNSGHVQIDGQQLPSAGALSNRNKIINGDMRIDQRNAGTSVTPTINSYTLDRWICVINQSSKFSIQQNAGSVTPPAGFSNYIGVTSLSSYTVAAGDVFSLSQVVEGYNVSDLALGTSNAKSFTISFWVRSSLTGTFGGAISGGEAYPFAYTISSANTWEYKTITIPGTTAGTWNTTNSSGLTLRFSLGSGSTYSGTAGAWGSTDYYSTTGAVSVVGTNAATFYITGVQLEVGSVATPFEHRSYADELYSCQRYYQEIVAGRVNSSHFGYSDEDGRVIVNFPLPREPRTNIAQDGEGTVTRTGVVRVKDGFPSGGANNNDDIDFFNNVSNCLSIALSTTASGVTEGSTYLVRIGSATDETVFTVDNEL